MARSFERILCTIKYLAPLFLLVLFSLTGCANTGTLGFKYSREVASKFETPVLLPDHTYYFYGSETEPDAVVALDNRYQMNSKVWSRVDITQEQLEKWAFQFDTYPGWFNCPYRGVVLFATDGNKVGAGYSKWTFSITKITAPGEIVVFPPRAQGNCRRQAFLDDL